MALWVGRREGLAPPRYFVFPLPGRVGLFFPGVVGLCVCVVCVCSVCVSRRRSEVETGGEVLEPDRSRGEK